MLSYAWPSLSRENLATQKQHFLVYVLFQAFILNHSFIQKNALPSSVCSMWLFMSYSRIWGPLCFLKDIFRFNKQDKCKEKYFLDSLHQFLPRCSTFHCNFSCWVRDTKQQELIQNLKRNFKWTKLFSLHFVYQV